MFVDKRERKERKKEMKKRRRKKRKKRKKENEEKGKERKTWSILQQGRFFSYLGDPWSRGFSMAMEFSPNMEDDSKQFECKPCTFFGHLI